MKYVAIVLVILAYGVGVPKNVILEQQAPSPSALVIQDTGYNSATDLLQTVSGTFVYQGSMVQIQ